MKCEAHEGGIAAGKIILDGIVDQPNQLTVAVYQNWDKQVALQKHIFQDKSKLSTLNNNWAWNSLLWFLQYPLALQNTSQEK